MLMKAKDRARKRAQKGSGKAAAGVAGKEKLSRKDFEQELEKLEAELVKVQLWVQHEGAKIIVVFEGRDAAGKGGVIKRITERVSPRVFRVVALPAPTERQKTQLYIQRYLEHFPAAGEVVIFDRSWYNRAGVERVMGFCSERQVERFLKMCPLWERVVVESGIMLIKYWFEVSQDEQTRRFKSRINDGRKIWKLSPMDLESHRRWYDFSRARDDMLAATPTTSAAHVSTASRISSASFPTRRSSATRSSCPTGKSPRATSSRATAPTNTCHRCIEPEAWRTHHANRGRRASLAGDSRTGVPTIPRAGTEGGLTRVAGREPAPR
jgi:polyphosphate kinase